MFAFAQLFKDELIVFMGDYFFASSSIVLIHLFVLSPIPQALITVAL